MKTFIVCTSPKGRSISDYFFSLAEGLHDRGHKVIVITDKNRPDLLPQSTDRFIYLSWPNRRPVHFKDFVFFFRLCKKHSPDCVLGNFGSTNVVQIASYLAGVKNRFNYWHTAFGQLKIEREKDSTFTRLSQNASKKFILKQLATQILTNSKENKQGLREYYSIPEERIHIFHPLIKDAFANADLSLPREQVITFVGRVEPFKRQEIFVRELPAILEKLPDTKTFIVGAGSQVEYLRELAVKLKVKDSVTLTGGVKLPEVLQYMSQSKVNISASTEEAFGLVNVEALSAGTPIVANNVCGIKEILQNGYNGYAFDPEKPGDLAKKVVNLITDDWEKFSKNARQSYLDNFSLRQVPAQAEKLESLLK